MRDSSSRCAAGRSDALRRAAALPRHRWHLRHLGDQLAEDGGAFLVWRRDGVPVAAGLAQATVLRTAAGPAYDPRCDLVTWAPDGIPAAAATGWFAGPGRCASLEPVGTHADHRSKGFGRRVDLAVAAALAKAAAAAIRGHTPAANTAAVAAYEVRRGRPDDGPDRPGS